MYLLDLALDIAHLITELLEEEDLHIFRLVSQACRRLSEPLLFRTTALRVRLSEDDGALTRVCNRLCDPQDELRKHVRHLQVGPFGADNLCPSEQVLIGILSGLENLRELIWIVRPPMPDSVFEVFTSKWPNAMLHVKNIDRNLFHEAGAQYIPPDTKLLSSPQLVSLDYSVAWGGRTEFGIVRPCLLKASSLKRLHLVRQWCEYDQEESWEEGPQNLDFRDGEIFPTLEELSLPCNGQYLFSPRHADQWLAAMDWSKLRRLDVGIGIHYHLFAAMTGRVPQLELCVSDS